MRAAVSDADYLIVVKKDSRKDGKIELFLCRYSSLMQVHALLCRYKNALSAKKLLFLSKLRIFQLKNEKRYTL